MESQHKKNGKCHGINHKIMVAYSKQKIENIKLNNKY